VTTFCMCCIKCIHPFPGPFFNLGIKTTMLPQKSFLTAQPLFLESPYGVHMESIWSPGESMWSPGVSTQKRQFFVLHVESTWSLCGVMESTWSLWGSVKYTLIGLIVVFIRIRQFWFIIVIDCQCADRPRCRSKIHLFIFVFAYFDSF
jgi:hypothetical protein